MRADDARVPGERQRSSSLLMCVEPLYRIQPWTSGVKKEGRFFTAHLSYFTHANETEALSALAILAFRMYSEENKYLNTLQLCKFSHLEIMEGSKIFILGACPL